MSTTNTEHASDADAGAPTQPQVSPSPKMPPRMPPLELRPLEPAGLSSRAIVAIHRLERIVHIGHADVVERDGDVSFILNTHLRAIESHIPTLQVRSMHSKVSVRRPQTTYPPVQVQRTYAAFRELRRRLLALVREPHHDYCPHCRNFLILLLFSSAQPQWWVDKLVHSSERRAAILRDFIHNVVAEIRRGRPRCRRTCPAHQQLPILVADFLFD